MSSMIEPSESDKRSIYKHPLFPLMALLFERCEQVTQTPDCPLVTNLKVDIQSFVHHHQQRLVDFEQSIGERPEVDSLMIKAIQILWIHLLELDKVNELCKDFCTRYISCLRTKLQNEQLLHIDAFESDSNDVMMSTSQSSESSYSRVNNSNNNGGGSIAYGDIRVPPQHQQHPPSRDGVSMETGMRRSVPRELDHRAPPTQHPSLPEDSFYRHKSSKTEEHQTPLQMYQSTHDYPPSDPQQHPEALLMQQAPLSMGGSRMGAVSPTLLASLDALDDGDYDQKTKTKRGVLPKQATRVLKTWLFQHLLHPYPTEEEKKTLAEHTNLNILQVNNWFINARRRILQPMVDLNNQDGGPKAKKMKTSNNGGNGYSGPYSPERQSGSKSMGRSDSRSETSTPTSTTFDCDRNSLSEYSTKQQDDDDDDDNHDDDTNEDVHHDNIKPQTFPYDNAPNDHHGNSHETSSPQRCQDEGREGGYHPKSSRASKD